MRKKVTEMSSKSQMDAVRERFRDKEYTTEIAENQDIPEYIKLEMIARELASIKVRVKTLRDRLKTISIMLNLEPSDFEEKGIKSQGSIEEGEDPGL